MPNIKGSLYIENNGGSNGLSDIEAIDGGAIKQILGESRYSGDYNEWGTKLHGFSLDASLFNPIYGNSTTVQPASYTVYYIIKIK